MVDITKISTKGQIVIPNELRRELGMQEGDTLQIERVGDLIVLKKIELTSLAKDLGAKQTPSSTTKRDARDRDTRDSKRGGSQ